MGFQQFEEENLNERLDEEIMKSISGDIALYAGKLSEEQTAYIRAVVKGVANDLPVLDTIIEANSKGWSLNRLSHMTIAVLRLALFEMRDVDDVPVGVAINEAVELAKKYDTEDAASFINGVLGSAARAEFPQESRRAPMPERFLGIDTSNYRTSAAIYNAETGGWVNRGGLLTVPEGAIGLRQSDALFQHTVRLHEKNRGSAAGRGACHRRQHPSPRGGRLVYAVFSGRRERRAERGAFAFRAAFYRVSSAGTYRGSGVVGW